MKRLFDILVSLSILLILSPIILLIAVLVRAKLGSPILFKQIRPGLNSQSFEMMKFRTMLDAVDKEGLPLPDEERIPRFGHFLRASSLDELPGLWNVLKGDMSLVGPLLVL